MDFSFPSSAIKTGFPKDVKRDFHALGQRRFKTAELLGQGLNKSEVAHRLKVSNQTVSRWAPQIRLKGQQRLRYGTSLCFNGCA